MGGIMPGRIASFFRNILRKRTVEQALDDELHSAVELLTHEKIQEGLSNPEARRQAIIELGGVEQVKEEVRAVRSGMFLETFAQELRFGLRTLRKSPGFAAVAILTLALGIGANTAIYSVIDAALLRPLPYADADRIVVLYQFDENKQQDTPAPADYLDFKRQSHSFENLAAYRGVPVNLSASGDGASSQPERVEGATVTSNFFSALRVQALFGRSISPDLDRPGGSPVAVLSYGLWQRRFGSDRAILGRHLEIDGEPRTVVGVMPPGFAFPTGTELWMSSRFEVPPHPLNPLKDPATSRGNHYFATFGRLKPGVTLAQASAEVDTIGKRLRQEYPNDEEASGGTVVPLRQDLVGETRPALLILLGAVALVLLIACVNVANIILARGASRQKEMALRIALGAGPMHLLRQLLVESMLLATAGGSLGILFAYWGVLPLRTLVPADMIGGATIALDGRVLAFTLCASLASGLFFGLVPGMRLLWSALNPTLQEGGRDASGGARAKRMRSALVVAEIAMAAVLLIAAGLLLRSFGRLLQVPEGFNPDHVLSLQISLAQARYPQKIDRSNFVKNTLQRVDAVPGVASASAISRLPLNPGTSARSVDVEGRTAPPAGDTSPDYLVITPTYFQTMGVGLVNGRTFTDRDDANSQAVAVISQATAYHFWPGQDPVGKHFRGPCGTDTTWCEVVGVVADIKQHHLEQASTMAVYVPYTQDPWAFFALVVRTKLEPANAGKAVESAIRSVDSDQPVYNVRTMREVEAASLSPQRLQISLIGVFAALALVLACMGIYGVMSYSVVQRTNEIGVRVALGAQTGDVLGLVLSDGLQLALLGVGIGLIGSFFAARLLSRMLFGVAPGDPATFGLAAAILVAVALLACYIPARRATRVDPIVALRYE
jgi:putative ABC transport system permease protein